MNADRREQSDEEDYSKEERDTRAARRSAESLHRLRKDMSDDKPRHRPGESHRREGGHRPPRFYLDDDEDDDADA